MDHKKKSIKSTVSKANSEGLIRDKWTHWFSMRKQGLECASLMGKLVSMHEALGSVFCSANN